MTVNAREGDLTSCLEAGMDDYITKPNQVEILRMVLHQWVMAPRLNENSPLPTNQEQNPDRIPAPEDSLHINPDMFNQLLEIGGAALAGKVVGQFIQDVENIVNDLQTAIQMNNAESLRQIAHGLKGVCLNMGVDSLVFLARDLEQQGCRQDFSLTQQSWNQLQDTFHQVERYFNQKLFG